MECTGCGLEYGEDRLPRILVPCGHSLCETCLEEGQILCPECSLEIETEDLPVNLALLELKNQVCEKHYKRMEAFCQDDQTFLCVGCLLEKSHQKHDIISIPKAASQWKEKLKAIYKTTLKNEKSIEEEQKIVKDEKQKLIDEHSLLRNFFTEMYQKLKDSIETREEELLNSLYQALQTALGHLLSWESINRQQLEKIRKFHEDYMQIQNFEEATILFSAKELEAKGQSATSRLKIQPEPACFESFTQEAELNFLKRLLNLQSPEKRPIRKPIQKTVSLVSFPTKTWESVQTDPQANNIKTSIYTVNGCSERTLNSLEIFEQTWKPGPDSLTPRIQFGITTWNDSILVIGGKKAGKRVSSSEIYDPYTEKWRISPLSLTSARSSFGIASFQNSLYCVGGSDGIPLKIFEFWNGFCWNSLPFPKYRRDDLQAVVGPDRRLYVTGGHGGTELTALKVCERFFFGENRWEDLPSLPCKMLGHGSVCDEFSVYTIGGYDGARYLNSLYKFDTRMNFWVSMTPMRFKRCALAAVYDDASSSIYAIGGFNGKSLDVVEKYSIKEDSWSEVEKLEQARFMHGAVVFRDNYK